MHLCGISNGIGVGSPSGALKGSLESRDVVDSSSNLINVGADDPDDHMTLDDLYEILCDHSPVSANPSCNALLPESTSPNRGGKMIPTRTSEEIGLSK